MENGVKNDEHDTDDDEESGCEYKNEDENGNLKWVTVVVDDVSLYLYKLLFIHSFILFIYFF